MGPVVQVAIESAAARELEDPEPVRSLDQWSPMVEEGKVIIAIHSK